MRNTLREWRLKKAGILGGLVAASVVGALSLRFDAGSKLVLVPVVLILLVIRVWGRRIYACPHCKAPMDLRLPLHRDMKCTKCGRPIVEQDGAAAGTDENGDFPGKDDGYEI